MGYAGATGAIGSATAGDDNGDVEDIMLQSFSKCLNLSTSELLSTFLLKGTGAIGAVRDDIGDVEDILTQSLPIYFNSSASVIRWFANASYS